MRNEVDQVNSSPFTNEIQQAAPLRRFTTPSFTSFKGDSDPKSHLKHFRSVMILYKSEDELMCKVYAMRMLCEGSSSRLVPYRTVWVDQQF